MVSVGPTTSMRMEKFEYEFVKHTGVRVIVGKGGMGPNTERACKEFGAIHCVFPAGCAVVAATETLCSKAVCAVVSGTWDAGAAETAFGEGYAATKLPTFTCADKQVQMSCYSGFKLMGVNAYSKNSGWAVLLAEFLTNEASQTARFASRQLAPTNLKAAADEAVTSNVAIAASAAQDVYGSVQNVGGKFWDPTATFGQMIANGDLKADDDAAIQTALDTLVEGVTAPVE